MDNSSVEIRNPRVLKIIMGFLAAMFFCGGVLCWLLPFLPISSDGSSSWFEIFAVGAASFAMASFVWFPMAKFLIRADNNGITHHTGYKCKNVCWDEVASYYLEKNPTNEGLRSQLIFFDAQKEVLLKVPFVGNSNLAAQFLDERRELWRFVETQLDGKKLDAPYVSFEPEEMAARSLDVDWKSKTVAWKIARMIGLVVYAVFWCGVGMALMFAVAVYYPAKPLSGVGYLLTLLALVTMIFGPLIPHRVYTKIKARRIAREWETRD